MILPKSNRKIFLLQPFYKTRTHKAVLNAAVRGHWAGGARPKPRHCGGTARVRRGWGGAGAVPALALPSGNGWRRECCETETNSCTPMEHRKPCRRTCRQITPAESVTFSTSCNYPTNLPAQSWQWTAFGFLCTVQKDEFENSSNIYPNAVLNKRKTSSLLKRRFIHKQTSVFNNRPAN